MDPRELFSRCLEQATKVFHQLTPADYSKSTPDTEWDVRKLANHMLYELSWIPDLLAGKTIQEVGDKYNGDLVGNTPVENWDKAAALAKGEVKLADKQAPAHLSYGDYLNGSYLEQVGGDLFIHSWDLASALGVDRTLDPQLAGMIYEGMSAHKPEWQNSGLFGPEISVPADADNQTKLLALVGRNSNWKD